MNNLAMDSTNLFNHHQFLQQQQLAGYPFFAGASTLHDWNSTMTSEEEYYYKGHKKRSIDTFPLMNTSIFQDGHQLSNDKLDDKNNKAGYIISNDYFLKMKDVNGNLSSNLFKESYLENEQQRAFDLNENLLSEDSYMNNANKTSIAFSGLAAAAAGATNSSYISSHDMEHSNFQGLNVSGLTFKNSGHDSTSNCFSHFCLDRMSSGFADGLQELTHSPSSNNSNKITTSNVRNNIGVSSKAKRYNCSAEEEVPCQEASKKPRVTSQSSSTLTLKVRKEKLGDRISALHRLVAPFGKTDTASVLTEAIGYIQFLQDQIRTLSMLYTKSTQGKLHHIKDSSIDMKCQPVLDLESRGLCLVPTSFSSYITSSCD